MADSLQQQWQHHLDTEFPDGAIASWPWDPESPDYPTIYRAPWLEVVTMAGIDPVIVIRPFGVNRVVGPLRMVSHEVVRTQPHLIWAVTFAGVPNNPMLWCAKVPVPYTGEVMAERARQKADPIPPEMWHGEQQESA